MLVFYLEMMATAEEKNKFETFYYRYRYIMLHVAQEILGDQFLAEDAVQEAFLRIAKNFSKLGIVDSPQTLRYAVIVVRNVSLTMRDVREKDERRASVFSAQRTADYDPYDHEGSMWASKAQRSGAALHTFCYEETDFLTDAAKKYATLADDEVFLHRDIQDGGFICNTLDFFTGGDYSREEVKAMKEQMEAIVEELAQQIKKGEAPDIRKLRNKLTIRGTEVSIAELMEYQKTGKEITDSFRNVSPGTLSAHNIAGMAQFGIAKAMGNLYGSERGELGRMFSDAIDRLYDKAISNQEKLVQFGRKNWNHPWIDEAEDLEIDIGRMFGMLDTSSRESLTKSFGETSNRVRSQVLSYCYKYGGQQYLYDPYGSTVNLNGAMNQIQNIFQNWLNRIGK